jgi:hypothetical protein
LQDLLAGAREAQRQLQADLAAAQARQLLPADADGRGEPAGAEGGSGAPGAGTRRGSITDAIMLAARATGEAVVVPAGQLLAAAEQQGWAHAQAAALQQQVAAQQAELAGLRQQLAAARAAAQRVEETSGEAAVQLAAAQDAQVAQAQRLQVAQRQQWRQEVEAPSGWQQQQQSQQRQPPPPWEQRDDGVVTRSSREVAAAKQPEQPQGALQLHASLAAATRDASTSGGGGDGGTADWAGGLGLGGQACAGDASDSGLLPEVAAMFELSRTLLVDAGGTED